MKKPAKIRTTRSTFMFTPKLMHKNSTPPEYDVPDRKIQSFSYSIVQKTSRIISISRSVRESATL